MNKYGSIYSPGGFSPRGQTSASSSRRSSLLAAPRNISSRYSISGHSNQSLQVVRKTPYHIVEHYGLSLPVLVTEALTFADKNAAVSVCISQDGWAWFVCGRRLLIWQYKSSAEVQRLRPQVSCQCYELMLPPSDLAHRADLVCVFNTSRNDVPSCISVSPEGTIRYWPSIVHSGSSVEHSADLQGQECDSLCNMGSLGCLLATTTATIVLVEPVIASGRHSVICRTLRAPHGWLGGIGRRVSSLIFGGMPTSQVMETKLVKVTAVRSGSDWDVYVLAEHALQKWKLCSTQAEALVFECNIDTMVREAFHDNVWESVVGSPSDLDVWFLDMQEMDEGVMILVAATNSHVTPQLHYALGYLKTSGAYAPTSITSFLPVKYTALYSEDNESDILCYQFLLTGKSAYIYNHKAILAVSSITSSEEPDVIEFVGPGDRLLGGGIFGNIPIFFSKIHGLIQISSADSSVHDLLNSSVSLSDAPAVVDKMSQLTETAYSITGDDLEDITTNKDVATQLRKAFIYYLKNHKQKSLVDSIVSEIFPDTVESANKVDGILDTVAVRVSEDLLNDISDGDPRWVEVKTSGAVSAAGLGSSTSLQILHQLEDKQKALTLYITFLKNVKLWERLSAITYRNVISATSFILGEHAEKIVAAITLKSLQSSHGPLINRMIDSVIAESGSVPVGSLTNQDLFYREVTEIQRAIQTIVKMAEDVSHSERQTQEVGNLIFEYNSVVLAVLQRVIESRQQDADIFTPSTKTKLEMCEYIPWTAAHGSSGLVDSLLKLQDTTLRHGARSTHDFNLKDQLYDQLLNLTDIILDGYKCHLESVRGTKKFDFVLLHHEKTRHHLIKPFLDDSQYERASVLAEKYCDFQILVEICEATKNKDRLEQYMEKFAEDNFSHFVFNWYIRENKSGQMLVQFRDCEKLQQSAALSEYLNLHPNLSWLHSIFMGDFFKAGITLKNLAQMESEFIKRKKSMLSLAKLSLLAAGKFDEYSETVDSQINLVNLQEEIPEHVMQSFGFEPPSAGVLSPVEMIKLYISDENTTANELDLNKALDLLQYVDDDFEADELKRSIWCCAILKDDWTNIKTDVAISRIEEMTFFKVIGTRCSLGYSIKEFLPSVSDLLDAPELEHLRESSHFQFLLKMGYEHMMQNEMAM